MHFAYELKREWPPLAWLADCSAKRDIIRVYHGAWVETREAWFCEAAWCGTFQAGDFDTTDIVVGTGGRLRNGDLRFVASGSNLDRLHSYLSEDGAIVSNSLCCILAWTDASANWGYRDYNNFFAQYRYAILGEYDPWFPSSRGYCHLSYMRDLLWQDGALSQIEKPHVPRNFRNFSEYRRFLGRSMVAVTQNAADPARRRPWKCLCPISSGYDSLAVAVLASEACALETFTFPKDRNGVDDSGAPMAAALGLPCNVVDRNTWRSARLPEVPFIASSGSVGDLAFKSAEELLPGTLLLNGTSGGAVWNKHLELSRKVQIGDGALLGLTEYRLWTGFLNCAVPHWGVRELEDIVQISNSPDMKSWDLGGSYNRPIPRRIIEEAGIPRGMFARQKSGVSVSPASRYEYLLPASRRDFLGWLSHCRREQPSKVSLPHPTVARMLDGCVTLISQLANRASEFCQVNILGRVKLVRYPLGYLRRACRKPYYHHRCLVHWAVDRAVQRYGSPTGATSTMAGIYLQGSYIVEFTGHKGAGKTTLNDEVRSILTERLMPVNRLASRPVYSRIVEKLVGYIQLAKVYARVGRLRPGSMKNLNVLANRLHRAQRRLRRCRKGVGAYLLDEGLFHALAQVHVASKESDMDRIARVLVKESLPDLLVLVDASEEKVTLRRKLRGRPWELRDPEVSGEQRAALSNLEELLPAWQREYGGFEYIVISNEADHKFDERARVLADLIMDRMKVGCQAQALDIERRGGELFWRVAVDGKGAGRVQSAGGGK